MTTMRLQFWALPEEHCALLDRWLTGEEAFVAVEQLWPERQVVAVPPDQVHAALEFVDRPARLHVSRRPIDLVANGSFWAANPGAFTVELSDFFGGGLRCGFMGFRTDDPDTIKVWRRVFGRARRSLHGGVWIRRRGSLDWLPATGLRYSDGAYERWRGGLPMLQTTLPYDLGPEPPDEPETVRRLLSGLLRLFAPVLSGAALARVGEAGDGYSQLRVELDGHELSDEERGELIDAGLALGRPVPE